MASLTLVALALFAGLAYSSPAPRIAGGTPVTADEYPSIVQIDSGSVGGVWSQFCGGNILTARFVLSAAHCFHGIYYEPRNRRIRAGSSERNTGGQVVYVDREINHPTYGANDMDGDITVVRLSSELEYNDFVRQGAIIAQGSVLPEGMPVILAGWGVPEVGAQPSDVLLATTGRTINTEVCAERYESLSIPRTVTENMICASVEDDEGSDACQGDLGGPLYYDNQGEILLVGILSWGVGCGNSGYPGVNTAVSSYTQWIVDAAV